jgi:hypothetical protein
MHVCTYYVGVYVCAYVYVCIIYDVHESVCIYARAFCFVCICMCVVRVCIICVYICAYVYICLCMHVCFACECMYVRVCICMCVYLCVCVCMYVCICECMNKDVCVCMYVFMYQSSGCGVEEYPTFPAITATAISSIETDKTTVFLWISFLFLPSEFIVSLFQQSQKCIAVFLVHC